MDKRNDWGFAEAQWRLASGTMASERAAAAVALVHSAVTRAEDTGTGNADTVSPVLLSAGEALARSLQSEQSPSVRVAICAALEEMFGFLGRTDCHRHLIIDLVREVAETNRYLLSRFIEGLARYAVARRRMADAASCDPLQRLARLVSLGERESQTHQILRAIAATPECRQAVMDETARERSGIIAQIDGAALIESLVESAALLREGRDVLASAVQHFAAMEYASTPRLEFSSGNKSGLSLNGTFLAGISLEDEFLAYADLAGAVITPDTTQPAAQTTPAPVAAASPAAAPQAVSAMPVPATKRKSPSLRLGLAAAAKRAVAPLERPSAESRLAPLAPSGRMGRLETINSINAINAAARPDDPEETTGKVEIRTSFLIEDDPELLNVEIEGITDRMRNDETPSVVLSSGTVQMRDKALPKAARLTNADLLEITDLMSRR